jgi:cytochrome c biogenesis protein ResB
MKFRVWMLALLGVAIVAGSAVPANAEYHHHHHHHHHHYR